MSRVLVDTSVWVEMFRRGDGSPEVRLLGRLLQEGLACVNGLIRAELLSGARSRTAFRELQRNLAALPSVADPPDLWERVAAARYRLARRGFQASVADLIVALSASHNRLLLLTLDRDFERIGAVVKCRFLRVPPRAESGRSRTI